MLYFGESCCLGWRLIVVSKVRLQRIADRIREELSEILLKESQDPRLNGISVTDVRVDRELDYATIYVSALEGSERQKEILEGLKHAQGYLRTELTRRIELRSFPRLRFQWDSSPERAEYMESLFASLEQERASSAGSEPALAEDAEIEGEQEESEDIETDFNGDE
jgi:ribosome-binding factor A